MAGGGLSNVVSQVGQMGQQGGMRPASQPASQPAPQQQPPAYQSTGPNTGWNRPSYTTDPTRMSPTQNWWTNTQMGQAATDAGNQRDQAAFNATQKPIDRNTFNKTRNVTVGGGDGGDYTTTEDYFDQAGYDQALAAQKANTYTPLTPQEALNQTLRNQIQGAMGNYGNMVNYANRTGISTADIQNAIGGNTDMYTYMNRPNYQQYSPNGQFNQPIYQSNYQNYARPATQFDVSTYGTQPVYSPARAWNDANAGSAAGGQQAVNNAIGNFYQNNPNASMDQQLNAMRSVGINRTDIQNWGGVNNYGPQMSMPQMSTPFNPYTNSYQQQTPSSYQQPAAQPNYGPSQAIVSRSAGVRGTPNVVARRAEGGITSLMGDAE